MVFELERSFRFQVSGFKIKIHKFYSSNQSGQIALPMMYNT